MSEQNESEAPLLRIVRGNPTLEEIGALLGVVTAMNNHDEEPPTQTSAWSVSARKGRYLPRPSPSAWRLSLRST